jgi:hypothetical protein
MNIKLPKADMHGRFNLPNGSIIYPSGNDYQRNGGGTQVMPNAGKWMLWIKTGEVKFEGRTVPDGHFVMDEYGPKYFLSPQDALLELETNN